MLRATTRRVFRAAGFHVQRYPPAETLEGWTKRVLETHDVDLVVDVGANAGQYALGLRDAGYAGRILSFEPVAEAFSRLTEASAGDERWHIFQRALGSREIERVLNVSEGTDVSSFLEIVPDYVASDPTARTVRTEPVHVSRLDSLLASIAPDARRVMLKCDTQGFDMEVVRGASGVLDVIVVIQVELSVIPIYRGMIGYLDVIRELEGIGYTPVGFFPVSQDARLRAIELDGLFVRAETPDGPHDADR